MNVLLDKAASKI